MKVLLFIIIFFNVTFVVLSLTCAKTKVDGTEVKKPCVFPFTFNNVTYNECTKNHDEFSKPWCSTKVGPSGEHLQNNGHWGHCVLGINIINSNFIQKFSRFCSINSDWKLYLKVFYYISVLDEKFKIWKKRE